MKYNLYLIALVVFALSCNEKTQQSKSTVKVPEGCPINASGFARISTDLPADIQISIDPDSPYHCYLQCDKDIETLVAFNILNDELHITATENAQINNRPVKIVMRVKELKSLALNSSGNIDVTGKNINDLLEIKNTGSGIINFSGIENSETRLVNNGSGKITLKGQTKLLNARNTGSGNIHAYELFSENAMSSVAGSGNIEIAAISELEAKIVGSGNIFYKGTPVIKNNTTGSGMLSAK